MRAVVDDAVSERQVLRADRVSLRDEPISALP
jgi:hypothetical protein